MNIMLKIVSVFKQFKEPGQIPMHFNHEQTDDLQSLHKNHG